MVMMMMNMKRKLAEGFPLKLSSLIRARRAGSQSVQGAPQSQHRPPLFPRTPVPPRPPAPQYPPGNLDSSAVLTFCYIYSLRGG